VHSLLKKTIATHEKMMALLKKSLWDEILVLSAKRNDYLKAYFEIKPLPDSNLILSQLFDDITQFDEHFSALMAEEKSKSISHSLSLKNSHHAIQKYVHTQG